jgi:hypothetical protein
LRVLGINGVFQHSAAALVVDRRTIAAAEEKRFSRRKHGEGPVPVSAWEMPEQAITWCPTRGGLTPDDLDAVASSYGTALVDPISSGLDPSWEDLRFPRACREDSDVALRATRLGYAIAWGERVTTHPLASPTNWRSSLKVQAGDAGGRAHPGGGWAWLGRLDGRVRYRSHARRTTNCARNHHHGDDQRTDSAPRSCASAARGGANPA